MTDTASIILASGSTIRAEILRSHGVNFSIIKPGVDEDTVKKECAEQNLDLETMAMRLAEEKCMAVARDNPGFVIGSDQILEFENRAYDKPNDMGEARARITELAGKPHSLINATALALDGTIVWRNLARPVLKIRPLEDAEVDAYIDAAGPAILSSVGAYQIETAPGAQLFESIAGDRYAVLGLALYPLLKAMRINGAFGEEMKSAKPVLAGVLGHPIGHSLSPVLHNYWVKSAHINGHYVAIDAGPDEASFAKAANAARALGFAGLNVTIPHKEHALEYADSASDRAREIGAANMLSFRDDGVFADNSDSAGFATPLYGKIPDEKVKALLLGAGGAARAIIHAIRSFDKGAEITVANRTIEKAEKLASEFGVEVADWDERDAASIDKNLLVNTTNLGMKGAPALDFDVSNLPAKAVVYDIVYTPLETPLLRAAAARGLASVSGIEMLVWQAVPGFEAWFRNPAHPVTAQVDEAMWANLLTEMEGR
ncbi:MAG: shikimate dehydrogenase [Marinicaulis sp.]|nr:shikimate dehydrogenase [Marinicaulis sp.]